MSKARQPFLILVMTLVLLGVSYAQGAGILQQIIHQKVSNRLHVTIKLDGTFLYESFELKTPQRLVIDFSSVSTIATAPYFRVNDVGVLNIRVGKFKPTVARVEFELAERAPSYSVTPVEGGIKVEFWLEQEAVSQPAIKKQPAPEAAQLETAPSPQKGKRRIALKGSVGVPIFLKPNFEETSSFDLYGETGSITKSYSLGVFPVFDLSLSYAVTPRIRVGVGGSFHRFKCKGTFDLSLPHPLTYDAHRDIAFEQREGTNREFFDVYAFGLYSIVQTGILEVLVGPMLGLSIGDFSVLDDFEFTEASPYTSEDITITDEKYLSNSFSKPSFGLMTNFIYSLSPRLSLVLDARLIYLDSKVETMGVRANLFRLKLFLGVQASF